MAAKTFTEFKDNFRLEYGRLPTLGETWKAARLAESRKTVRSKLPVQQTKAKIKRRSCKSCRYRSECNGSSTNHYVYFPKDAV